MLKKLALGLLLCLAGALPACGGSGTKSQCKVAGDCPQGEMCLSCVGYPDGSNCKIQVSSDPIKGGRCVPGAPYGYCQSDSECKALRADLRCFGAPLGYCDLISI